MEQESTKSVTIDSNNSHNNLVQPQPKHLINTTKVLRGHKLKTQDFIKLQLMRFRYCSPVKYENQIQQNLANIHKTTEFTEKYRGFQYKQDDQKQLYKKIAIQRQKKSIQVSNRIKLLNPRNTQHAMKQSKMPFYDTHFTIKAKPATSHERRTAKDWKQLNNTISFNKTQTIFAVPINKIQFTSQNLGKKMNQYMNHLIDPVITMEKQIDQKARILSSIKTKAEQLKKYERIGMKEKNSCHNTYLKQMRKRFRSKYQAAVNQSRQILQSKDNDINHVNKYCSQEQISPDDIAESQEKKIFFSMQLKADNEETLEPKKEGLSKKLEETIRPYDRVSRKKK